jgi:hypothetical protein
MIYSIGPEGHIDGIFTLVVMDVLSDDDVVVFYFSMLEYPLMVVEHFVMENFAEQSEKKKAEEEARFNKNEKRKY